MEEPGIKKGNRFALLLPVCAILVTSALWLKARLQYPSSCIDCVPIPLQLAGMLNGPVALLGRSDSHVPCRAAIQISCACMVFADGLSLLRVPANGTKR